MKRAIIVHCWEGYPEYCWYPHTKQELETQGFHVEVPAFPDTENPNKDAWVAHLSNIVGTPDTELILIGHSIGCATILRYLEGLKDGATIGGAILVAGFTDNLGFKELDSFFTTALDFEKLKKHCPRFIAIHSDNDPYVPLTHGDIFKEKVNAEVIIKHNAGHFSGSGEGTQEMCTQLPDVVHAAQQLMS